MTEPNTPNDGDFAAYLEQMAKQPAAGAPPSVAGDTQHFASEPALAEKAKKHQTLADILIENEDPTEKFLEECDALENAPPLSNEELAQQALRHPGADGDPETPE